VGKRARSDLRKRTTPVCPEVLTGVVMADGINLLNKTELLGVVGQKAEEGYIRRYCKKKGITAPWDVKPDSWIITDEDKEFLDKIKSGRLNSTSTGNSEVKTEKIEINTSGSSLDSTLKKIEERIASMEKINTSGSPLDSTLKKMEERMASMETKMEQRMDSMNTKLAKVDELGTNVANISLLVARLMQQAGLNAASG